MKKSPCNVFGLKGDSVWSLSLGDGNNNIFQHFQIFYTHFEFNLYEVKKPFLNSICTNLYKLFRFTLPSVKYIMHFSILGYSNPCDVFGTFTLLFNNRLETAFHWPYCFVDCVFTEIFYSFPNTFTELQLVPLFNLFLQNLLFKLVTNQAEYVLFWV